MTFSQLALSWLLFSGYVMRKYLLSGPAGPKKTKLSSLSIKAYYTKNDLKKTSELYYPLIAKPKMILDKANKIIDFSMGKNIKSQITFASKRGSSTIDFEETKKDFQNIGKDVIKYGEKFNFSLLLESPKFKIASMTSSFKSNGTGDFKFHLVLEKIHKAKSVWKKVADPNKIKLDKFDVIFKVKNPSQEQKDMVSWFKNTFPKVPLIQN